ncbi:MAG TPA: hypothetical protein VF699_05825, partial [Caulobacteraceae bacterium]
GLGHTARAALDDGRVRSVRVIEALGPVIDWHRRGLVPLGAGLAGDPQCAFVEGDFFAMAADEAGFDTAAPGRRFDAVLLDIDHSPGALLHAAHAGFYSAEGLPRLARWIRPGGVFAMWSDAGPEEAFLAALRTAFAGAEAQVVTFENPLQGRDASCTIYVARAREK